MNTINEHINNIYDEGKLEEEATCKKDLQVRNEDGREVSREISFYNLDMILAIGYRVRSTQGMHFRKWATERLKEYLVKGFTMNNQRLKDMTNWHIIERLVPLVENNYNLCELGPRGTGKSYVYKEISPNSILISGGQSTVANLFYNMNTKQVGLVGMWDTVAFDEIAGMKFKDKDGVQIMKDFMASGSFARGREEKNASASMVFVGNINESVESILKSSHLFSPFPEAIAHDTTFFDRMHYYLPGWEIPKMRPEFITDEYGFIVDYLAEFLREMRKHSYTDAIDEYFSYCNNLNQRDVI